MVVSMSAATCQRAANSGAEGVGGRAGRAGLEGGEAGREVEAREV